MTNPQNYKSDNLLCYLSAQDALDALQKRNLKPSKLLDALVRRIERFNPIINALADYVLRGGTRSGKKGRCSVSKANERLLDQSSFLMSRWIRNQTQWLSACTMLKRSFLDARRRLSFVSLVFAAVVHGAIQSIRTSRCLERGDPLASRARRWPRDLRQLPLETT